MQTFDQGRGLTALSGARRRSHYRLGMMPIALARAASVSAADEAQDCATRGRDAVAPKRPRIAAILSRLLYATIESFAAYAWSAHPGAGPESATSGSGVGHIGAEDEKGSAMIVKRQDAQDMIGP